MQKGLLQGGILGERSHIQTQFSPGCCNIKYDNINPKGEIQRHHD